MRSPDARPVAVSPLAESTLATVAATAQPALAIRIDRIVLDGVAVDSTQFRAALHDELQRLLSLAGDPAITTSGALSSLRVRDVAPHATATGRSLGESLARALHAGLWP